MEDLNNKNNELKGAIVKAIAFFDLFDYPLTLNEIWQYLSVECKLVEVMAELENNPPNPLYQGGTLEEKNGFYFLAGRGAIAAERLRRYNFTDRKFKRALLVARIFKFIPWIKMIAAGNLLGAHNLKDDGDVDFFIIAEDKRIWLTRFFCVGVVKFLGLRPQADNSRDKICLSFYASEARLDLRGLMLKIPPSPLYQGDEINPPYPPLLKGAEFVDIYFLYWLAGLTPLYDAGGAYHKLIKANQWLYASLPNWQPIKPVSERKVKPLALGFYRDLIDLFIGGLEPQLMALQLKLLPPRLKNLMNLDGRVVVNDEVIKLHANDRREEYRDKFFEKIRELHNNDE